MHEGTESEASHAVITEPDGGLRRLSLLLVAAAAIALYALGRVPHSNAPDLTGSWEAFDTAGHRIVYHFSDDGTGYRLSAGRREVLRYAFAPGYPNRISIRFGEADTSAPVRGLVSIVTPARILLQLSRPGEEPPVQLDDRALDLRRPPTR